MLKIAEMNIFFLTLGLYLGSHLEIRALADIKDNLKQGINVTTHDIEPNDNNNNTDDAVKLNELNRQQETDVTTLGIKPNDNIDDAARLNELIAQKTSGTLYFPAGNYLLASPVILKSNITLKGAGAGSVIFTQTGNAVKWMSFRQQGVITTNGNLLNENVHVNGITLRGIYKTPADGKVVAAKGGICMVNCKNSSVASVTTYDTWHGVAFYNYSPKKGNSGNVIRGVKVYRAKSFSMPGNSGRPRGILMSTPGGIVENCLASSCGTGYFASGNDISLIGCKAEEWTIDNGFYIIVNNCRIERCEAATGSKGKQGTGSGFVIAYSKGGVVKNCVANNCSNYGFRIHVPQSDLQLTDNKAERCGIGFGIENASHQYPEMCKNLVFRNNVSAYCNLQGFLFRQMENSEIKENTAKNNNQKGIQLTTRGGITLADHCFNNRVEDNTCDDDQVKKTQLFGLYDYSKAKRKTERAVNTNSKAFSAPENNIIKHKSRYGQDYY